MNKLKYPLLLFIALVTPLGYWIWHFANDQWLESRDTMHLFYVLKRWSWSHIQNGELPLWNPHLFTGFYQLASPALGVFSPITAFFYTAFDSVLAEQLQLPLYALTASLGAFYLAREFSLNSCNCLLTAVAFSLNGFLLSLPDRSPFYYAYALYPLLFVFMVRHLKGKSIWNSLGYALVFCLLLMNGDWVGGVFVFLAHLIYSAHEKSLTLKKSWPLILALGLSAVSILPVFENLNESTRAHGIPFSEASSFAFHPLRLLTFVAPEFWGYPNDGSFWGHAVSNAPFSPRFWYHSIYMGSVIGALGILGLYALPLKIRWLAVGCFIFFMLLSMGEAVGLHTLFYKFAPAYKSLRYPEKFLIFSGFIWFVCSIAGLKRVQDNKKWVDVLWLAGLWHTFALLALCFAPTAETLTKNYSLHAQQAGRAVSHIESGRILHFSILLLLLLLCRLPFKKFMPIGLALITTIELIHFAPPMHWVNYSEFTEDGVFTKDIQQSKGRYLLDLQILPYSHRKKIMLSNWPILDGLNDLSGYETIMPLRLMSIRQDLLYQHLDVWARVLNWTDVITQASPKNRQLLSHAQNGNLEALRVNTELNLALLRWNKDVSPVEFFTRVEKSESSDTSLQKVIARGTQKGSAILEFDVASIAPSENFLSEWKKEPSTLNSVEYTVTTNARSLFVERSAFHEGWQATIDDQPTALFRVDNFSRGLWVPAGTHKIKLKFRPPLFFISAFVSIISLIVFLVLSLFALCREKSSLRRKSI